MFSIGNHMESASWNKPIAFFGPMRALLGLILFAFFQVAANSEPPALTGDGAAQLQPADTDAILALCRRLYPSGAPAWFRCSMSSGTGSSVGVFYSPTESSERFFRGPYLVCFRQDRSYQKDQFDFVIAPWVLRSKEQLIRDADGSKYTYALIAPRRAKRFEPTFPPDSDFIFARVDSHISSLDMIAVFDEVSDELGAFTFAQMDRLGTGVSMIESLVPGDHSITFSSYLGTYRLRQIRLVKDKRWVIRGIDTLILD